MSKDDTIPATCEPCGWCAGTGAYYSETRKSIKVQPCVKCEPCGECGGHGAHYYDWDDPDLQSVVQAVEPCKPCNGTGRLKKDGE